MDRTAKAEELLRELGGRARLVVYVASAPGSGKTRRLLEDARRLAADGKRVVIGWIETKGRPDLERTAAGLPRIPPRRVTIGERIFEDFDYEATVCEKPEVVLLDELAHDNLGDSSHPKRWQDALALRKQGISVIGAFNIQHLETVAPTAEALIGYPVREIIPLSFLQAADEVVALDVSPRLLQSRVKAGKIVNPQDVDRALGGVFKEQTLYMLRELLLRTVDNLTLPVVEARRTSMAAAFVYPNIDPAPYLKRTAAIVQALDLALEVVPAQGVDAPRSIASAASSAAKCCTIPSIPRALPAIGYALPSSPCRPVRSARSSPISRFPTISSSWPQRKHTSEKIRRVRRIRKRPATGCVWAMVS